MASVSRFRSLRRYYNQCRLTFQSDENRRKLAIGLTTLAFVFILAQTFRQSIFSERTSALHDDSVRLFIAIGSAPRNAHLRQAARDTWLSWLPSDRSVSYRFFSDAPPSTRTSYSSNSSLWRELAFEGSTHGDIVQQPLPSGYGDKEHNAYGLRALFQAQWAIMKYARLDYFLRVDDDSFLCLHRLIYELKSTPREQFFWGRFWCNQGRNRADENFMLFSADIVRLFADDTITGRLMPFDRHVTLGWNFGYWSWILNMTIFDDQNRIDAQQGYLTTYMHSNESETDTGFCNKLIYAHHVPEHAMRMAFANTKTHLMYTLPDRRGPRETCKQEDHSFIAARHSKFLPNIKIEAL